MLCETGSEDSDVRIQGGGCTVQPVRERGREKEMQTGVVTDLGGTSDNGVQEDTASFHHPGARPCPGRHGGVGA